MRKSRWTSLALTIALVFSLAAAVPAAAAPARSTIVVEGQELHSRHRPMVVGGHTLVPFRATFAALGARVSWDGAGRSAVAVMPGGSTIRFPMDQAQATVDGRVVQLPISSRLSQGTSYVPTAFLSDVLGLQVRWDVERLIIETPPKSRFEYGIIVDLPNGRVGLTVKNVSNQRAQVTFNSSQTHDFIIRQGSNKVWQASDGQAYLMLIMNETFNPGQARTYWTGLPQLAAGSYVVEAYFPGSQAAVARTTLNIPAPTPSRLTYGLLHDANNQRLGLMVYNGTGKDVTLTFPTSKTHDFVLRKNGVKVWQASDDQVYLQVVQQRQLRAGEHVVYWTDLPDLPGGTYAAEAYFAGNGAERRVASSDITIVRRDPLRYNISFQARSMLGNGPRLTLEIRNPVEDLTMPAQFGYRIVVKKATGPDAGQVMPGVGFGQSLGTFAGGATRYHYVTLHNLPTGTYLAEVQSNIEGSYRTVAATYFVMP